MHISRYIKEQPAKSCELERFQRAQNVKICQIWDFVVVREPCNARKLVEYDPLTKKALVYHIGKHSCFLKIDKQAICDEVKMKFGDEIAKNWVKGCQWHFKNQAKREAALQEELKETFRNTCQELCTTSTVAKYMLLKPHMDVMAKKVHGLQKFITWWDDRRSHIFGPFCGAAFPRVNLSEQGNAGWLTPTLRLVHACKNDIATIISQQAELKMFEENECKGSGCGQSVEAHMMQDQAD